jgi:bifunctional UDP-N-acetylglucosamine pyrophosphorylase/glucosamine-1-phosphate N-acetyltransferase/UDP-N-acetylglucosamine pyrophosphorylase
MGERQHVAEQQTAGQHVAVVMAAGKGTRMKSELPKVLIPACGRPMIEYVLRALRAGGVERIIVVVGYRADLVRAQLAGEPGVTFVDQTEQLGTGHAVMVCRPELAKHDGAVLVVTGDSPLIQVDSIRSLKALYDRERPACIIGTTYHDNPEGLGRIVRDAQGDFAAIVEHKDATPEQRAIREVNMSTYVFDCRELLWALDQLTTDNSQREYYITDCPGILRRAGRDVPALDVLKPCEALSINTFEQLAEVEAEMRRLGIA